jgi:hypothetical protein
MPATDPRTPERRARGAHGPGVPARGALPNDSLEIDRAAPPPRTSFVISPALALRVRRRAPARVSRRDEQQPQPDDLIETVGRGTCGLATTGLAHKPAASIEVFSVASGASRRDHNMVSSTRANARNKLQANPMSARAQPPPSADRLRASLHR